MPFLNVVLSRIPERPVNGSSVGLDLCYNAKSAPRFPSITFHFAGGSEYVLPENNAFISFQESNDTLVCLAFDSAGPAGSFSILGKGFKDSKARGTIQRLKGTIWDRGTIQRLKATNRAAADSKHNPGSLGGKPL